MTFPPFRLDLGEEQLWKGAKLVAVRRKPFAILRYLVTNPRRLVTHEELLKQVWGGAVVSESAVRTHLHELRQVLGDGLIETVIGRGYRFTADVAEDLDGHATNKPAPALTSRLIIGRSAELEILRMALERARTGQRQLCFVTGEPGIGKTTLVDAFLEQLEGSDVIAVRGQNVEQHGTPEAYLSVIEMIGQLRSSERGEQALAALVRYAPTFLAHLPNLVPDEKLEEVQRRAGTGSETRMVRELIEALDVLCMQHPLVIVLEDLQWSDVATLDLLAVLGQRRERAKLLVIATSRRSEAQTVTHPLNRVMRALIARSGAIALPLDRIEVADIGRLIDTRFPAHTFPPDFLEIVERITAGTPLFLTGLLDDLVGRGMVTMRDGTWSLSVATEEIAAHRPENVKQLIDIQLDRLTPQEQRILEAASLVGLEFATALVAAALDIPVEQADELCDSLARRSLFLRHAGTEDWPDQSQQSRYGFTHGLVQEVCIHRTAAARRQRWHRLVAERLEAAYGDRAPELATTLATHHEHGNSVTRAIHFHTLAAERMTQRFASVDALPSFRRALDLLKRTAESSDRDHLEWRILGGMVSSVLRNRFESGESIAQFERMIVLSKRIGDPTRVCASMAGLSVRYSTLARYDEATALNDELVAIVTPSLDAVLTASASAARALPLFWQGQVTQTIELLEPLTREDSLIEEDIKIGILDPSSRKTVLISYIGAAYWLSGAPDRGLHEMKRAVDNGLQLGDPYTRGLTAINYARIRLLLRRPVAEIRATAETVLADPEADMWHLQASLILGWADSHDHPLAPETAKRMLGELRDRMALLPMGTTYTAIPMCDALRRSGLHAEARELIDEVLGFATSHRERVFEPELLRLRGELLEPTDRAAAIASYLAAIELAEANGAWALALRSATRLAKVVPEESPRLAAVLAHITDGFNTPDVVDANELLRTARDTTVRSPH